MNHTTGEKKTRYKPKTSATVSIQFYKDNRRGGGLSMIVPWNDKSMGWSMSERTDAYIFGTYFAELINGDMKEYAEFFDKFVDSYKNARKY